MTDKDLYGGLIRLHILHHAAEKPVFGLGIIEELRHHGYEMSAGTLYPMLHGLEKRLSDFASRAYRAAGAASLRDIRARPGCAGRCKDKSQGTVW